jgi:hypothetical protein
MNISIFFSPFIFIRQMKLFFTYSTIFVSLFLASCGQTPTNTIGATTANIDTESKRNIAAAPDATKKADNLAAVARNWSKANTYINLKLDGTFEAALEAGTVMAGKWQISEDEKTLTLQAEKSLEGKGATETLTFTIEQLNEGALIIKDSKGTVSEFAAS